MRYSKIIVALVITLNAALFAAVLWTTLLGHALPDSFIIGWFAFTGTELVALAGITITEKRHSGESADENDGD